MIYSGLMLHKVYIFPNSLPLSLAIVFVLTNEILADMKQEEASNVLVQLGLPLVPCHCNDSPCSLQQTLMEQT